MRRGGTFAFIIYLTFTLLSFIMILLGALSLIDKVISDFEIIGIIGAISAIVLVIPYFIMLIFKVLHFISGARFFGILCIITNIIAIIVTCALFVFSFYPSVFYAMLPILLLPLVLALFSEIRGLNS